MEVQIIYKNLFSLINIILVIWLLYKSRPAKDKKSYLSAACIVGLYVVRVVVNFVSIHIVYNYFSILILVVIIGNFVFKQNTKYSLLIGSIFLYIILLGQLISCFIVHSYGNNKILVELSNQYQIYMVLIAEIVIILGCIVMKRVVKKLPLEFTKLNLVTILIPLFFNIVVMGVCADQLYYEKAMIIGNVWSFITMIIICIIMLAATICNIAVLENYLSVKKIENEKKLQISEMSLQYDYYVKQLKDMESVRRLSHDIKNHLEALKENIDESQKIGYINGIEHKLEKYQSYYSTGNPFIDNLLHIKKLDAIENGIEFKVFADFVPFSYIKNEDLCVIIANVVDNALRECCLIKEESSELECLIQLKARKIRGFLSITCENSLRKCQVELLNNNLDLVTTKLDKKNHGFGTKNVIDVVQHYEGEVSFHVEDEMFYFSAIIPI